MASRNVGPKVDRRKFLTGFAAAGAATAITPPAPYSKAIMPDADLGDIHAYLQSIPKAPDPKSIPLLNP